LSRRSILSYRLTKLEKRVNLACSSNGGGMRSYFAIGVEGITRAMNARSLSPTRSAHALCSPSPWPARSRSAKRFVAVLRSPRIASDP
jgi:hypothetical protein